MGIQEGELLWKPSENLKASANITIFQQWLKENKKLSFESYDQLWQWSVDEVEQFWEAVWQYFDVKSSTDYSSVLVERKMPGAEWFPGSSVNFAEQVLRNEREGAIALHTYTEFGKGEKVSWLELGEQVRKIAQQLRNLGVTSGDRVATYLPNTTEAVVVLLAASAVGAIFSSCSPDFGHKSVIDRFQQVEPKILFTTDGYRFGGKDFDRRDEAKKIAESLTSLEHVIHVPNLFNAQKTLHSKGVKFWADLMDLNTITSNDFVYEQVPFDHPLWILYSSGTTGLPKPIVHGHGGIILEFYKLLSFHMNLSSDSSMFFYTTTGWMMWNLVVGSLITGGAAVLYDGNPAGSNPNILWELAEDSGTTFFGASPTFIQLMDKEEIVPKAKFNLEKIEGILLGGSPATPESMQWCYDNVKQDLWVTSQSGGTDICSGFVGASPTLPVYAGEIQARCLGVDAHAYSDDAESIINKVGELVITKPMPSMPLYFWNDEGNTRYLESYFEDFPGVWRHGDYFLVNERGGCFIYGRSDSTLNRYGVRIGTAEIYRTVEQLDEVEDSLIVNLDLPNGKFFMPLFVKLKENAKLNDDLQKKICTVLREKYSPRHVPDKIIPVDAIPYTLTKKKMEVPIRKIISGVPVEKAANKDAMANPDTLNFYISYTQNNEDFELS
jgi:acetoacetyl-CoA synthetase